MPVWLIFVLAFGTGFGIGLLVGGFQMYFMMKRRLLTQSNIAPTPDGQRMLECMTKCAQTHAFGSVEWSRCVGDCYRATPE